MDKIGYIILREIIHEIQNQTIITNEKQPKIKINNYETFEETLDKYLAYIKEQTFQVSKINPTTPIGKIIEENDNISHEAQVIASINYTVNKKRKKK
jgi:hypothetical protein